ncbi:MAG: TonB-dependent receptor [Melioribacter sp.]|uniref:TonB-dependent receptor n=1 Tax=Rosettibacter primus TaxID=3111523 RepID=UPI00247B622E|nr:TonB-dependent receptor [Melioribacter sp.]
MKKINIFILIIYLWITIIIDAQTFSLIGYVKEEKDDTPLIGVNVLIEELKIGTTTDTDGKFEFNNLKSGTYSLKFSYIGHKTITRKITIPSIEPIVIKLEEGIINLQEVVVTGNPLSIDPKNLSQSTLSISNLELQIKRNISIAQILNFQPGIAMRSNGIAAARPIIRGFSNNRVLILENGLRMGDLSNTSDDHAISADGNTPEKIEVLRGPASLLYGSNAIGGVVNIITEDIPNYISKGLIGDINFENSSVNKELNISSDIHFGFDKFSFHSNYFNRYSKDYTDGNGSSVFNSDQFSRGYQLGFAFIPSFLRSGISIKDYFNSYGIPTFFNDEEQIKINMKKKEYRFLIESDKINFFVNNFSLKAGYQNYEHKEILRATGETGTSFGLKSYSFDLSFKHKPIRLWQTKNISGVFGLWYQKQNYNVFGDEAFTPNANYDGIAAYIFEQIRINKLNMQLGVRIENNRVVIPESIISDTHFPAEEKNYLSFSGSVGISYNISDDVSLFSNIANAFRAPTVEELSSYAIHEATAAFDIGNRNLNKENNLGFDLGLRVRKANHLVELSSYHNMLNNFIYRKPTNYFYDAASNKFNDTSGYPVFIYSQSNASIYGFELIAQYEFTRNLSLTVMMDYVRGIVRDTKENLPQMPPFRFSIEQRYFTDNYWFGYQWKLAEAQNKTAAEEKPTKGYGIVDIYCGVKILTGKFFHIISLKIENLLDQPYKDHLSSIKNFAYMPGRNLQMSYKFLF